MLAAITMFVIAASAAVSHYFIQKRIDKIIQSRYQFLGYKELTNIMIKVKEKIEKNYLPLIDKYRPKKFKNIILNDVIKSKISAIIDMKIMPNMIIVGPPGTGKTSLVTMMARNMLEKLNSNLKYCVLK